MGGLNKQGEEKNKVPDTASGTYETAYQSDVPRTWTDSCRERKAL